jgi:hypothetical protein
MDDEAHLPAVATLVKGLREDLGLTLRDAAALGDLGTTTWNAVEQGRPVKGRTYSRIERALDLPAGTLRRLRDTGMHPTIAPKAVTPVSSGVARIAHLIRMVDEAEDVPDADRMAITATMTAALAHMKERATARNEREAG